MARALASGVIDVATAADGLRRTQAFLDTHLSRQHDIRIDAAAAVRRFRGRG